jgi:hypothetical protein
MGFRQRMLRFVPPSSEDVGFPRRGALVPASARRQWFLPAQLHCFQPVSEDQGLCQRGLRRFSLLSEDSGFRLHGDLRERGPRSMPQ